MVVFIENDEYIDPFAEGKGLRVAIHEFNTQAHPMQSAVSVSPNANAYIALKMVSFCCANLDAKTDQ